MTATRITFVAEVWEHDGPGAWHFVTLPSEEADHIDATTPGRRGFGSVRVEATIGATRWSTSIFPDRQRQTFVLPLKKAVRLSEELAVGTTARVDLLIHQS